MRPAGGPGQAWLWVFSFLLLGNAVAGQAVGPSGYSCSSLLSGTSSQEWCSGTDSLRCQSDKNTAELSGASVDAVWDFAASGALAPSVPALRAWCFAVGNAGMEPVSLSTLSSPPFIDWPSEGSSLELHSVELRVSCSVLKAYQALLCSKRLPAPVEITGALISFSKWSINGTILEDVSMTCDAGPDFLPACTMTTVESVGDISAATQQLQNSLVPLVLTPLHNLDFGGADWPAEGLSVTSNVTISSLSNAPVTIDFQLKTVLFRVETRSTQAFLMFRGCVLLNLPLTYLPLEHPRRPFGILSTGLWPVYREQLAIGLTNCTLVLNRDEFKFWSYWLSILVSPIPAVRQLGNWSAASYVKVDPSGEDYISLDTYKGRYTYLSQVRYEMGNGHYKTQQRNNILQITGREQVPPTVVYQVRDSEDLSRAIAQTNVPSPDADHGRFIVFIANVTIDGGTVAQPPEPGPNNNGSSSSSNSSNGDGELLDVEDLDSQLPADYPAPEAVAVAPEVILNPLTMTTWPGSYAILDLQQVVGRFNVHAATTIKNVVLLNLGAAPPSETAYAKFTTGLWVFNITNWRNSAQQMLSLENMALVAPVNEVAYYYATTVGSAGRDSDWITSFKVQSYDTVNHTWVYYYRLTTVRFAAVNINITSRVPDTFDMLPITLPDGGDANSSSDEFPNKNVKRSEVLMFALVAITLPTALGAAVLTYVWIKRRRLQAMCAGQDARSPKHPHTPRGVLESGDTEGGTQQHDDLHAGSRGQFSDTDLDGAEEGKGRLGKASKQMSCCFPLSLPLPLRKAKFINPLFAEPGDQAAEVVLTGVLGPVGNARGISGSARGRGGAQGGRIGGLSPMGVDTPAGTTVYSGLPSLLNTELEAEGEGTEGEQQGPGGGCGQLLAQEQQRQLRAAASAVVREPADGGELGALSPEFASVQRASRRLICSGSSTPQDREPEAEPAELLPIGEDGDGYGGEAGGAGAGAEGRSLRGAASASAGLFGRVSPALNSRTASGSGLLVRQGSLQGDVGQGSLQHSASLTRQLQPQQQLSPRMEMQRLDRLRQEIGDRHLEVHHSLGWGGCGVVYKGTWKGLPVAVKTVLVQGDSRQSRQFLTEAAISASLQHVNIVTTYLYELRPLDEVKAPGRASMEITMQERASLTHTNTTATTASWGNRASASGVGLGEGPSGSAGGAGGAGPAACGRVLQASAAAAGAGAVGSGLGTPHVQDLGQRSCWKLYIVQEFCELGTLKSAVDQGVFRGPRSPNMPFLLAIALDVTSGLAHIHSKDVVHGDVTVSNVLLQTAPTRPQGCIAKVADFGLSVKLDSGQTHRANVYGGTPHYMAPERTRGQLHKASDVYSLGVCLWELYCGTPPWRRNTAHNRHYGGEADPHSDSLSVGSSVEDTSIDGGALGGRGGGAVVVTASGADVLRFPRSTPPEFSGLVVSCLASEPSVRPTVREVHDALLRLQRRYG